MFKQIPKSDISERQFKVYKEWVADETDYPIITAYDEGTLFDPDTSNSVNVNGNTIYTTPLYRSIISKYYSSKGNVFTQYGMMKNPALWGNERYYEDIIYVVSIPQSRYGEEMKKGSIVFQHPNELEPYIDNGYGSLITANPTYLFISYDDLTGILIFTDEVTEYNVSVTQFDMTSGIAVFTYNGITDTYYLAKIDFQTNIIELSQPIDFDESGTVQANQKGNVFYDDGLIVLTKVDPLSTYELEYRSVQTIYETEVLVSANVGEFNYSQNPSAINITVNEEYDFEVTKNTNISPAGTVHIVNIKDIALKDNYTGSIGSGVGSWDDYYDYGHQDPTGSYLATMVSTIGLYDDKLNLVAVAKLPKPIKKLPDYNLNFIVRFDT